MIEAHVSLRHSPDRVFAFLSDLRNHWRLEDAFIELGGLEDADGEGLSGGRVRIRGPLGLYRDARTRVLAADPPAGATPGRLAGRAEVGPGTVGRVGWEIVGTPEDETDVRLWATVEHASLPDRLLLALGGRHWLARIFRRAVGNLSRELDDDPIATRR